MPFTVPVNNKRPFGRPRKQTLFQGFHPNHEKKKVGRKGPTFWDSLEFEGYLNRNAAGWQGRPEKCLKMKGF
jgi:hypothetical protein